MTETFDERARRRGLDPVEAGERAAIHEYEAGLPRWAAEALALGERSFTGDELDALVGDQGSE
jgi:hypothetical protein